MAKRRKRGSRKRRSKRKPQSSLMAKLIAATPASKMTNKKYAKVAFNWSEAYQKEEIAADGGELYGWVLNRPGPNTGQTYLQASDVLTERNLFKTAGVFGLTHNPYLWREISSDFEKYRVYACEYKLTVKNQFGRAVNDSVGAAISHTLYVAAGVTQMIYGVSNSNDEMTADHIENQPVYIEGRNPEWKRKTLRPGQSHTFSGVVHMKNMLKKGQRGPQGQVDVYPWFDIPKTAGTTIELSTTDVGADGQNQPYHGWSGKFVQQVKDAPNDIAWSDATYGDAPQSSFLYLSAVSPGDTTTLGMEVSLSCRQYIEFKRPGTIHSQS